jgi:hypothetical protein
MNDRPRSDTPFPAGPLYLVAILLIVTPLVDIMAQVWPLHLGAMGWRYSVTGLAANYVLTPVMGLAFACLIAATREHRRALGILAVVCAAGALLLLIASVDFTLDAMQVQYTATRTPEELSNFQVGAAKAILKHLTSAAALAWLALASLACWRAGASAGGRRRSPAPVVSRSSEASPRA